MNLAINPVLIDLGFIQIYWYSVMILIGVFVGSHILIKESRRYRIPEKYMTNMIIFGIIMAIIGARAYYVIFEWDYYGKNIADIFKIWQGGLAIHGGLLLGLLFVVFYTKKYKVKTARMLDMIVVGLIIGQAIGRWGNFFNGEAHGTATTLEFLTSLHLPQFIIDGMNINGIFYHPTFLYESLWCLIGFIVLLIFRRMYYTKIGQTTALYMIWYGVGRFLIESMRTDSLMLGEFRVAQIVSVALVSIGILVMIFSARGPKMENRYNDLEKLDNVLF